MISPSTSWAAAGTLLCALAVGCSKSDRSPTPASLDGNNSPRSPTAFAPTACSTGAMRECSVTLGTHEGVLNCYHGQQVCLEGGTWSSCGSGAISSLPAPGQALRGTAGLRFLAITGAEKCAANPCDPYCLEISAADGEETSTFSGDVGSYEWQTGTLEGYPNGLVKKGLVEPCSSGSDCQFNTKCLYPVSTSCAHGKCETGAALDPSCNGCVADICEVDPSCCPSESAAPPECAHDPCLQGSALEPTCDPCVTSVCLGRPECCTSAWDASCRDLVLSTCGNSCACAAGEIGYDNACYVKQETDLSWAAARTACQARGVGWDLLSVNDAAENQFIVASVIDDSETWIGLTDGNGIGSDGQWQWANGSPPGSWDEASAPSYGDVAVFGYGSSWRYRANNADPGAAWTGIDYNDSGWSSGAAELGFGDGDEATSFSKNGPSYYFRRTFSLTQLPTDAELGVIYDDGYVAYVNGTEVSRDNIGDVAHSAYASSASNDNDEATTSIVVSPFVLGSNVLAVLVKNGSASSSDVSFDARLTLTYGPERPIAYGTSWRYYAGAAAPSAAWASPSYIDSGWSTGNAQLGFGEGDEATAFAKTGASYYFRKTFSLTDTVSDATLSVTFDDGFVAYLNGSEVRRRNITDPSHAAYASNNAENEVDTIAIATSSLVVGENVLAVVVKNGSSGSNDLSFDAQLELQYGGSGGLYENFGGGEPGDQACVRFDEDRAGTWGDKSCAQQTDSVCEGPPGLMIDGGSVPLWGAWTAVDYGATWKYRANTSDPGAAWNTVAYADSAWSSGPGQLGYGDGDEGTSFSAANPSYYFRKVVNIPTEISDATLSVIFDDGFVVYVNGVQVATKNVGSSAHNAYATTSSNDNDSWSAGISKAPFVVGSNTIAALIKNSSASSSDVSFDLKLEVTLCGASGCPPEPAWSESCVQKVGSVCDAVCDTSDPPASTGQCVPRFPGEVDASCAGIDLSIGVPCDDNIPVCNHGTATAPAGLRLVHFPANSQQFPTCEPNTAHPQTEECFTTHPITPGECVNVTGCPGLNGNREIMVNPPGASHVGECSCRDNWSLFSSGECGEPSCDGGSSIATLQKKPVDIVFVIDNSGSMQGEIAQVQQRINEDFAQIIADSGLDYRVIMMARYGDIDTAVGGSDYPICVSAPLGGHDCSNPTNQGVAHNPPIFYHYSTDVGSLDGLCRLLQGLSNSDELTSVTRPWTPVAPNGYETLLREEARKAIVVITDDRVNCSWGGYTFNDLNTSVGGQAVAAAFDTALLTLSPEQFGTAATRNYVFHSIVAMAENTPGSEPWPTSAPINTGKCTPGSEAPGTGYQGLSILTGGLRYPTCRNNDFDAIFRAVAEEVIEGATVSCSVELAHNGQADPNKTTVRFTPGSGPSVVLQRVSSLTACASNSYYYEDASTITLCPTTCVTVQADLQGSLGVEVGCVGAGGFAAKVLRETYESECNEDTRVQWGFLTYNSTTPGDSSVQFRVRTAEAEAELDAAVWVDLASAHSTPSDTQICGMGGPAPCPVDLYTALGVLAAHHRFAQVEVTLNPTSDATDPATIQGWQLNYSCPFAQ